MSRVVMGGLLLLWSAFLPAAILNVTFTVKNDGTVVANNDWGGTFDNTTGILTLRAANMPAEFRDTSRHHIGNSQWWFGPVGYETTARLGGGWAIPVSLRLKSLKGRAAERFVAPSGAARCNTTYPGNPLTIHSDNFPYTTEWCSSYAIVTDATYPRFVVEELQIVFFEKNNGVNALTNRHGPAGQYYTTSTFFLAHVRPSERKPLVVNTTINVEPSLSTVNMPSELKLAVQQEAGMMVGHGALLANVSGTLGRRLTIAPRPNGPVGKLITSTPGGQTAIPYTLDVTPLGHDYLRRTLVDGQSNRLNPVVLPLDGVPFDYQLRFDVNFRVPMQGLVNGRYHSTVTLMFSTSEV